MAPVSEAESAVHWLAMHVYCMLNLIVQYNKLLHVFVFLYYTLLNGNFGVWTPPKVFYVLTSAIHK